VNGSRLVWLALSKTDLVRRSALNHLAFMALNLPLRSAPLSSC